VKAVAAVPAPAPVAPGPDWPAYAVERWPISRLRVSSRNARTHSSDQIAQLRAAMRKYGWTMPILVREDGTVIAGHGRLMAGQHEGFTEVPVIIARGWSDEQCRTYALADNKLGENSVWDEALLTSELNDLAGAGVDLAVMGFSAKELKTLLAAPEEADTGPQLGDGLSYAVVIRCKDEAQQMQLLAKLQADGLTVEALIT
jgi:ParB-like chromosome segregation protein Spo0J